MSPSTPRNAAAAVKFSEMHTPAVSSGLHFNFDIGGRVGVSGSYSWERQTKGYSLLTSHTRQLDRLLMSRLQTCTGRLLAKTLEE